MENGRNWEGQSVVNTWDISIHEITDCQMYLPRQLSPLPCDRQWMERWLHAYQQPWLVPIMFSSAKFKGCSDLKRRFYIAFIV